MVICTHVNRVRKNKLSTLDLCMICVHIIVVIDSNIYYNSLTNTYSNYMD